MFSLCSKRAFQVFVAFIILPLSYCPVRFLDLTPLIFSHQSVTSNPPISLIISFELSPSFWGTQVPKMQCSCLGVVSPQSQAAKRGGRVGESWMHLKLVLICISKIVLFHPLSVCLPLFLLFSFCIMHSKIGFFHPHVLHSHLTKLVASWTSSKVVLLWSLYTMCIALAYADSESSDELYFPLSSHQPTEPERIHVVDWSPTVWQTSKRCWTLLLDHGVFWAALVNVQVQH